VKKILILGGGVIGLCSAYYAARRGHRVTIVEREEPGYEGCSFGNAGMICPSHVVPLAAPGMVGYGLRTMWNAESPFYIRPRLSASLLAWGWRFWRASSAARVKAAMPVLRDLHLASRALYEELHEATGGAFGLERKGLLMLCKTQHGLDEEAHGAGAARALGIPAEVLDAKAAAALDPAMTMDVAGAVYYPKDCHFTPDAFMAALENEVLKLGVEIMRGVELRGWVTRGEKVEAAQTTQGALEADEFVLCCGIWSAELARDLDLRIPMQAGKGYSVTLDAPRQLPALCSILVEARVAVTPMKIVERSSCSVPASDERSGSSVLQNAGNERSGSSVLRFGGTMELSGISTTINERRVRGIVKSALKYFPAFRAADFEGLPRWSGMRPCSPDGLPYLGRGGRYGNVIVATGHAMMGMSLGPITGKLVAEIASGETPSVGIGLLDAGRYG